MAFDKVIDSTKLFAGMTATANAIRGKTGGTNSIEWNESTGFKAAVEGIQSGGNDFKVTEITMGVSVTNTKDAATYIDPMVKDGTSTVILNKKVTTGGTFVDAECVCLIFLGGTNTHNNFVLRFRSGSGSGATWDQTSYDLKFNAGDEYLMFEFE